jgi:hypothetical protein
VTDGVPSFAADVRGLFREEDRDAMEYVFDLWSYDDVRANAEQVLERLEDGSMPCDEEWPQERVALFRSWVDAGMPS